MKILLAIDGSPYSDAAVVSISKRPWPAQTEVRLITVEPPLDANLLRGGAPTAFDEIVKRHRAEATERLHRAAAVFRQHASGVLVTPLLREGRPKEVILEEAERWGADLIVVGSHGYGAVQRLFLGSVSLAVATGAPCSVEIVRPAAPGGKEVAGTV